MVCARNPEPASPAEVAIGFLGWWVICTLIQRALGSTAHQTLVLSRVADRFRDTGGPHLRDLAGLYINDLRHGLPRRPVGPIPWYYKRTKERQRAAKRIEKRAILAARLYSEINCMSDTSRIQILIMTRVT